MTSPINQAAGEMVFGTLAQKIEVQAGQDAMLDSLGQSINTNPVAGLPGVFGGINGVISGLGAQDGILGEAIGTIYEVFTGVENGDGNDLASWVNILLGKNSSIASRVARIEGKIATGAEFFDDFNRGDSASSLGKGWVQGGTGQAMGIYDQAAQSKRDILPTEGRRWARCPTVSTSDDMTVAAVIHPLGTPPKPATTLFTRCNEDMTNGIYVHFYGKRTILGKFTRSGNSFNFVQWATSTAKPYSNSSTVELQVTANKYTVAVDGQATIEYLDVSGTQMGGNFRTAGFALEVATDFFAFPEYSGGLASFALRSSVEFLAVQEAAYSATEAATSARVATTAAQNAETRVESVSKIAENADAKAQSALDGIQSALDAAQQAGKEFMVASAGVVLGRNEVNIGPVVVVPNGRDYRTTSVTYGMEANSGGVAIELLKVSPGRVPTVMHTANIPAGTLEIQYRGLNIPVENGYRLACNVIGLIGQASVLLCSVDGALL